MSLLQDVFTYFAKFPLQKGVLNNFIKAASDYGDYATYKTTLENMDIHSMVPEIKGFVFGLDETIVRKRIKEITGAYLFVDYGNIHNTEDHLK